MFRQSRGCRKRSVGSYRVATCRRREMDVVCFPYTVQIEFSWAEKKKSRRIREVLSFYSGLVILLNTCSREKLTSLSIDGNMRQSKRGLVKKKETWSGSTTLLDKAKLSKSILFYCLHFSQFFILVTPTFAVTSLYSDKKYHL